MPIHFVRYEDLNNDPKNTLTQVFKFLLKNLTIEKSVIHEKILQLTTFGTPKREIYKKRQGESFKSI